MTGTFLTRNIDNGVISHTLTAFETIELQEFDIMTHKSIEENKTFETKYLLFTKIYFINLYI